MRPARLADRCENRVQDLWGSCVMSARTRHMGFVLTAVLFVSGVAVVAYLVDESRRRTAYPLDDEVVGVKLVVPESGAPSVVYQNGVKILADGLGVAAITWEDYTKFPARLDDSGAKFPRQDFPLVVFFNATGFDATGVPVVVRRASDGELLYRRDDAPSRLALVTPLRDGRFRITPTYLDRVSGTFVVSDERWYTAYMGRQPAPAPSPSQESGLRGRVWVVGGATAPSPGVRLPYHVLRGKVEPYARYDRDDGRLVLSGMTGDGGEFSVALPAGAYTFVVELDGVMRGNAFDRKVWPSVEVKTSWVDYEVRLVR